MKLTYLQIDVLNKVYNNTALRKDALHNAGYNAITLNILAKHGLITLSGTGPTTIYSMSQKGILFVMKLKDLIEMDRENGDLPVVTRSLEDHLVRRSVDAIKLLQTQYPNYLK